MIEGLPATEEDWGPPPDWDELIVCPTCDHHREPDEDEEDGHLQLCPECGFTLTAVKITVDDDGKAEVSIRWEEGEGPQLFVADAAQALKTAQEFWAKRDAEDERIDDAMTSMRLERRAQADAESN